MNEKQKQPNQESIVDKDKAPSRARKIGRGLLGSAAGVGLLLGVGAAGNKLLGPGESSSDKVAVAEPATESSAAMADEFAPAPDDVTPQRKLTVEIAPNDAITPERAVADLEKEFMVNGKAQVNVDVGATYKFTTPEGEVFAAQNMIIKSKQAGQETSPQGPNFTESNYLIAREKIGDTYHTYAFDSADFANVERVPAPTDGFGVYEVQLGQGGVLTAQYESEAGVATLPIGTINRNLAP